MSPPFDGLPRPREDQPVAAKKTQSLTLVQMGKALVRLLNHEDPKIQGAAWHAVNAVLHEEDKRRSWTLTELQTHVVWVLANGASLLANSQARLRYVVPHCMQGLSSLAADKRAAQRITGKVTAGAVKAAVQALSRSGPGRRKGPAIGDRSTLLAKLFGQLGIPTTPAAVSKLLERHARVDLSVIWTNET